MKNKRTEQEIEVMHGLLTECYEDIKDTHEKNELQAAMTILRRNYTADHYIGTPYEKITNAAMEWLNDSSLSDFHILGFDKM